MNAAMDDDQVGDGLEQEHEDDALEPSVGKLIPLRRRVRTQRAVTTSIRRLPKRDLELGRQLYPHEEHWRPKTRGECKTMERPCPFVSCRYHLAIDVNEERGAIKENYPGDEVEDRAETCALDVADQGGITLEEVGEIMNLTRERVRQLETQAMEKLLRHHPELKATLKAMREQRAEQDARAVLTAVDLA